MAPGHGQALGDLVDADHPPGAPVQGDAGGHLTDGAEAEHGQRATLGNGGVLHCLPGGG